MVDFDSDFKQTAGVAHGQPAVAGSNFLLNTHPRGHAYNFDSGVNSGALGTAEVLRGNDLFEDKDIVEVDFLIAPSMNSRTDQTTIVNDLITTAQSTRKDCVVVASPARTDVVKLTNAATIT